MNKVQNLDHLYIAVNSISEALSADLLDLPLLQNVDDLHAYASGHILQRDSTDEDMQ
jgi:hypothetical protein